MRYAVYALGREYGPDDTHEDPTAPDRGADQPFYTVLRKPAYEAYKAYTVMRHEWGLDVVAVCPDRPVVAGDRAYPSLSAVPENIECVISFLPSHLAQMLADDMSEAGTPILWRMFGPVINGFDDSERAIYRTRGIRVVNGCVLAHWDVAATGIPLHEKLHHACYIHGLGARKLRSNRAKSMEMVRGS